MATSNVRAALAQWPSQKTSFTVKLALGFEGEFDTTVVLRRTFRQARLAMSLMALGLAGCGGNDQKYDLACTEVVPAGLNRAPLMGSVNYRINLADKTYCSGECQEGPAPLESVSDFEIVASTGPVAETFLRRFGTLRMEVSGQTFVFDCKKRRFSGFPKPVF